MEATRILGGIAFVAAFFAALGLSLWLVEVASRNRYSSEAAALSGADSDRAHRLLRNGIPAFEPLAKKIMNVDLCAKFLDDAQKMLAERNVTTYPLSLASLALGVALTIFVTCLAISQSWVFAMTAVVLCAIGANGWVSKQQDEYRERLREELPSALQTMNACFCIGYSLPQIFEQSALDLEGPLKAIFQKTAAIINAGGTVEEALDTLKAQSDEPELYFLATALEIQHRTGSSLAQVLDVVRQSVDDQLQLKRLLKTQTAQAKLSAKIVTIMPFLIIGIFSLVSEGFLDPFFTSTIGIVLLAIALAMQAGGIMLIHKMLKVEVV